ncbi:uncharacterized protein LOC111700493 [Eurytemora carolleeae]|uniref:uncharacterized protein LOC111700493 n=1 Tax=Eurytemora carolleeae TaxID=1294199 RepID=UPI000C76C106|nr:uncharacterized protein LOC111700493 [Eurytemora carolleeae]|eukprot:XP_023327192.1 uncharacterized protein LOC111700493 [Eurytemora affinis]
MKRLIIVCLLVSALSTVEGNNNQTLIRTPKQGLFSIVNFPNLPCRGSKNNLNGTCISSSECSGSGGSIQGTCAQGFGACCFYSMNTCGGTVTHNQTYLQNPGYPSSYSISAATTCTYKFYRTSSDVCQIRLDFDAFDLGPPIDGNQKRCSGNTDLVTFTPAGAKTDGFALCGYNPGSHIYIDMGSPAANPNFATMTMAFNAATYSAYKRYWNIMVSEIDCNTIYSAPVGCGQYYFGNGGSGVIQSFNYDNPVSDWQSKLTGFHTICIRREKDMCTIGYAPPDVDKEEYGFALSGSPTAPSQNTLGRNGCGYDGADNTNNNYCHTRYVYIPQGTVNLGNAPYVNSATASVTTGCDRFCHKRLCNSPTFCKDADHDVIYSKVRPFNIRVEFLFRALLNRGYKLNYFQLPCS